MPSRAPGIRSQRYSIFAKRLRPWRDDEVAGVSGLGRSCSVSARRTGLARRYAYATYDNVCATTTLALLNT
eukprot:13957070-Heterocapsa_arctica.AAC.1